MARGKDAGKLPKDKGPIADENGITIRVKNLTAAESVFNKFAQRMVLYENNNSEDLNKVAYMRTGCLPFDLITGGKGVPRGRFTLLYSEPGAGKSTLLFSAAKGLCNNGYKVLYADAESSDDTASQMGLIGRKLQIPEGSFKYLSFSSYLELELITDAFTESDYDVMMIDSVTAIGLSKAARKKLGKTIEEASSIGLDARVQTGYIKNTYCDMKGTDQALVYIAQTRNKIDFKNPANNGPAPAGSNASKFFANLQIQVRPSTLIKDGVKTVGRMVYLVADKNRHASPLVRIPATVFFGRGVSNIDLLIKLGEMLGIFKGSGAWLTVELPGQEPIKVSGRPGIIKWITDNYAAMVEVFYANALDLLNYFGNGEAEPGKDGTAGMFQNQALMDNGVEVDDDELEIEDDGESLVEGDLSDDELFSALNEGNDEVITAE